MPRKKAKSRRHVYNMHRAMQSLSKQLDHFEMTCVKNGLRLKLVRYGPSVGLKKGSAFEYSGMTIDVTELK